MHNDLLDQWHSPNQIESQSADRGATLNDPKYLPLAMKQTNPVHKCKQGWR